MGPGYFVIALLGCADGGAQCTPVATLPTQYASQSACSANTGAALLERTDLDFPTVVAECRARAAGHSVERSQAVAATAPRG